MTKASLKNTIDALNEAKLFSSVSEESVKAIAENYCEIRNYRKGAVVFGKNTTEKCIGVILKGLVAVKKEHITISHLQENDIFGAVTLYNKQERFVNNIIAESDCRVAFVSKEGVDYLITKSPRFAKHYIEYLSQRIYFLNSKIESYTMPSADEKLYNYLIEIADGSTVTLNMKMTELSKLLNFSRASLYRSFDELVAKGKIIKDDKNITIL